MTGWELEIIYDVIDQCLDTGKPVVKIDIIKKIDNEFPNIKFSYSTYRQIIGKKMRDKISAGEIIETHPGKYLKI